MTERVSPALDHVDTWVFDLDNTLYPASADLFPQIDKRMKRFIADLLKISEDDAFHLQKTYYREFGTTLRGLMLNHHVDADAFLDFVHDIDHTVLAPHPELANAIGRLPGQRLIHTNGSLIHAEKVVSALGISHLFDGIFDIKAGDYVPKPDTESYSKFFAAHGLNPKRAAMFEDSPKNLEPAATLGMVTVLVRHPEDVSDLPAYCHYATDNLVDWLEYQVLKAVQADA